MENQYKVRSYISIALALIAMFSSCSRQTTSIAHVNNMTNSQTLATNDTRTGNPVSTIEPTSETLTQPVAQITPPSQAPKEEVNSNSTKIKRPVQLLAQLSPKKFKTAIHRETAAIKNLYADKHTSSYSKTFDTGGFLGLAVLCLIAAIVLAYFGFHGLAALLWIIGIILFAAAILFFILWLIGRAVAE